MPSDRDTVRDLAKRGWTWWRGLSRGSQAALIVLVLVAFLIRGCSGGGQAERAGVAAKSQSSSPAATATSPSSVATSAVRTGAVPEDLDRITSEIDAEEYAYWLDQLGEVDFDEKSLPGAIDDIKRLSDDYGNIRLVASIPAKGSRVRGDLSNAAKQLESGDKALRRGQYGTAEKAFESATRALKSVRSSARTDLLAIEVTNALRLTRDGAVPDDASTEHAKVIAWVDGDTVDTDKGRVRVLGIDTPEMHEQCVPAQAAKDAAAQLAPAGQRVDLVNPESVQDTDKYGRLLRYVDVMGSAASASHSTVDVGYSLLLSNLAEPRYDSQDGYQWHPRESAYRATNAQPAGGAACPVADERGAFVLAATLASTKGEDEYWRHKIINEVISHPYSSASKNLQKYVTSVRRHDEKAERAEKEADEEEAAAARRREARERSSSNSSNDDSSDDGSSGSGGGDAGYTGPRCYAPGGTTWKPC